MKYFKTLGENLSIDKCNKNLIGGIEISESEYDQILKNIKKEISNEKNTSNITNNGFCIFTE